MAEQQNHIDVSNELRAAADNTLGLFSEDIVENFLRDIDEEALAELSQTGKSSEQPSFQASRRCLHSSLWTKTLTKTLKKRLKRGQGDLMLGEQKQSAP